MSTQTLFGISASGAHFSACGKYRFALWRIWDETRPMIMFIGLNPSTANGSTDDPTIRRVVRFAKDWGAGGVYMMNLFTLVTPNPKDLLAHPDPAFGNDGWLDKISDLCNGVIFAWGNFKEAKSKAEEVIAKFPDAYCLKKNKNGTPIHPLYVKADIVPVRFNGMVPEIRDSIPWGESDENLPYRDQMIASYNEAKAMFEAEVIITIKTQKNKK